MLLGRDEILKASDLPTQDVDCPEWGGVVRVRGLRAEERAAFHNRQVKLVSKGTKVEAVVNRDTANDAFLVSLAAVNDNGDPVFTEKDVAELAKKSSLVITRLSKAIQDLSGMSKEAEELLGKNSEDTGGSPSS